MDKDLSKMSIEELNNLANAKFRTSSELNKTTKPLHNMSGTDYINMGTDKALKEVMKDLRVIDKELSSR